MPKAKKILIYKDYGSLIGSTENQLKSWIYATVGFSYHVDFTDATKILEHDDLNNDDVAALIIPGGHSKCYENKLGFYGAQKIQQFIVKGGFYIGICGGAYYACKTISFAKNTVSHSLQLINATAKGPLTDLTCGHGYDNTPFASNAVSLLYKNNKHCNMHYSGGCAFIIESVDHDVLANYEVLNLPAAIRFEFGKGKVTLVGVHPESSPADFFKLSEEDYFNDSEKQHIIDFAKLLEHSHNNNTHTDLSKVFLSDLL